MADTITAESLAARYREQVEAIRAEIYTAASESGEPQPTTPREWAHAQVRIDQEWIRTMADAENAGISGLDLAQAICAARDERKK